MLALRGRGPGVRLPGPLLAQAPVSGWAPPPACPTTSQRWAAVRTPRAGSSERLLRRETCALNYRECSHLLGLIPPTPSFRLDLVVRLRGPPIFLISLIQSLPCIVLFYFLRDLPTLLLIVDSTVTDSPSGGSCWSAAGPFFKSLFVLSSWMPHVARFPGGFRQRFWKLLLPPARPPRALQPVLCVPSLRPRSCSLT